MEWQARYSFLRQNLSIQSRTLLKRLGPISHVEMTVITVLLLAYRMMVTKSAESVVEMPFLIRGL